jgi:hypothetical protein
MRIPRYIRVRIAWGLALTLIGVTFVLCVIVPESWPMASASRKFITQVSSIASVVAFIFAVWESLESRGFREALSTRFIGEFPDFLPQLVGILEKAERDLIIVCDFPSYGQFSSPSDWKLYSRTIEDKVNAKISLSLVCMNEIARANFAPKQFFPSPPYDTTWSKYRDSRAKRKKIQQLVERHDYPNSLSSLTFAEMIDLLEKDDLHALQRTFSRVRPFQTPMYFWVCDKKVAIFSFPTYDLANKSEFAFLTFDRKLIQSLLQVFKGYQDEDSRLP